MDEQSERNARLYVDVRQHAGVQGIMTETTAPATPAVPPEPLPALVGIADLTLRWGYTRQGVHKVVAGGDFPPPAAVVNGGRVRVWRLREVEAFERGRPELGDEAAKQRKQTGYFLARLKG